LVLHAGDNSRPQVQLVIQGPAADDVAAELELRLELLRDATDVDTPGPATVREGTAAEAPSSDESWEVAEQPGGGSSAAPLPPSMVTALNDLPLDVRRLSGQLRGTIPENRARILAAWDQGLSDCQYLRFDDYVELPSAAHEQNHDLVAGYQLKWYVVLRTATRQNTAPFLHES
jgi:hypothetical protein